MYVSWVLSCEHLKYLDCEMVQTHVFLVISVFSLNLPFLLSSSLLPWLIFAFKFAGVEVKFCNLRRMHVFAGVGVECCNKRHGAVLVTCTFF